MMFNLVFVLLALGESSFEAMIVKKTVHWFLLFAILVAGLSIFAV